MLLAVLLVLAACGEDARVEEDQALPVTTVSEEAGSRKPGAEMEKPDMETAPPPTKEPADTKPELTQPTTTEPEPAEPETVDPGLYEQVAGTYMMYRVVYPDLKLEYEQLCQMGETGGYIRLEADGTGVECLGEISTAFTYDLGAMTMTRTDGTRYALEISGEMVTVYMGDTQVCYVREGSPLLEYDPVMGTYWLHGMSFGESYADHEAIRQAGLEEVHVVLYTDGSGAMVLPDQEQIVFTYDLEGQTMTDASGKTDALRLDGQVLTITDLESGEEMIFREEEG